MEPASCTVASDGEEDHSNTYSMDVEYEYELVVIESDHDESGVSEAAAAEGLYAGHAIKEELVIGPELIQQQDIAFDNQNVLTIRELNHHYPEPAGGAHAAPASTHACGDAPRCCSSTELQYGLRSCSVKLEKFPMEDRFMECGSSTLATPPAQPSPSRLRRLLRDARTDSILNYGSEEEDFDDEEEEAESRPPVSRVLRVLLGEGGEAPASPPARAWAGGAAPEGTYGPTNFYDFNWTSYPSPQIPPFLRRETFVGTCGPTTGPIPNPYDAFVSIWDRSIMEHIAAQTNRYAQEYAARLLEAGDMGPQSRIANWRDTDVDELYVYFALVVAMGVTVKTSLSDYWTTDKTIFSTPGFSHNMTIGRFQLLSRCLHFNDNSSFSPSTLSRSQAKIYKLQPIVDHLNSRFSTLYGLGQNIAVDESLSQWKGWLAVKQYIPHKATTMGIKTYEVCDSRTGYLWRFEIHAGSEPDTDQALISGAIPNLVLRLLRGLEYRGHTVWMDNYYNSPGLARVLKTLGCDCVGTLRTNRKLVPEQIRQLKSSDMAVGQVRGCTSGDVDLMVWRDRNYVSLISTYHGTAVADGKPVLVKDYNVNMGGVDKKDQMLSMYPMERKRTKIWYKKFFRRLLNVSVLNAFVLYKHYAGKVLHRQFRMTLVTSLLKRHYQRPETPLLTVRGKPRFSAEVLAHFPSQLPTLPGGDKNGKQRRQCVLCKTKRTHYVCKACNVALCFNPNSTCYVSYHK